MNQMNGFSAPALEVLTKGYIGFVIPDLTTKKSIGVISYSRGVELIREGMFCTAVRMSEAMLRERYFSEPDAIDVLKRLVSKPLEAKYSNNCDNSDKFDCRAVFDLGAKTCSLEGNIPELDMGENNLLNSIRVFGYRVLRENL